MGNRTLDSGLTHELNSTATIIIDGSASGKCIEATHTAANPGVTFAATTPAGSCGEIIKNTGSRLLVIFFAAGATQILPQAAASNMPFNLFAEHAIEWVCVDNAGGSAARYLLTFKRQRHVSTDLCPALILADHATGIYRVGSTGTTTIRYGSVLRRGFNVIIFNPPGSGFTRTLVVSDDATPGPSHSLVAGEVATIWTDDQENVYRSVGSCVKMSP